MPSTRLSTAIERWLRAFACGFFLLLGAVQGLRAQQYALSTNLADYAGGGTLNLEGSRSVSRHWTLLAGVKYNPFGYGAGGEAHFRKQRLLAAGARYWPWHVYSGWWLLGRLQLQEFHDAGLEERTSREGDRFGASLGAGYARMLTPHWNLDLGAGFWAGHERYVAYACLRCGQRTDAGGRIFFLPADIILSVSYIF